MRVRIAASLPFDLPRGAVHLCRVAAGAAVSLAAGEARIDGPPRWLADTLVHECAVLRPGTPWRAPHAGWIALHAVEGARGVRVEPPPARGRLAAARAMAAGAVRLLRAPARPRTIRSPRLPLSS